MCTFVALLILSTNLLWQMSKTREVNNRLTGGAFAHVRSKFLCPPSKLNLSIAQNCPPSKLSCPQGKNKQINKQTKQKTKQNKKQKQKQALWLLQVGNLNLN